MRLAREADLKRTVAAYLTLHRIFWWPNNTGAVSFRNRSGKDRFVKFGCPGSPDLFALRSGVLYGIELKAPGGKLSAAQVTWGGNLIMHGGRHVVARSLEDVMLALEAKVV